MDLGILGLLAGMLVLGFRHGFDWDHIAAITDITSTTTASHADEDVPVIAPMPSHAHDEPARPHDHSHADASALHVLGESRFAHEQRHAVGLASLYALGHASVVLVLGVLALLVGAVLPGWIDPILQRVVGVTLVLLGVWVVVSVVQYVRGKGEFRMRSRWMLVFDGARYDCARQQGRIHGHEPRPASSRSGSASASSARSSAPEAGSSSSRCSRCSSRWSRPARSPRRRWPSSRRTRRAVPSPTAASDASIFARVSCSRSRRCRA